MKNTSQNKKGLNRFFIAFLAVAIAFLAVGLGTIGSVYGTGDAYELRSDESAYVDFNLTNPADAKLSLVDVYVNVAAIYAEEGTPVTLRVERFGSLTSTASSSSASAVFENFTTLPAEEDENGKTPDVAVPDATDEFYRFVSPFKLPTGGWAVSSYPKIRLSVYGGGANVLINEVVFVGEVLGSDLAGTGQYRVIPAKIYKAEYTASENPDDAIARAQALLDSQRMPTSATSFFNNFSKEEIYSLRTISEMRIRENSFDQYGNVMNTYLIDGVYGALGHDFLALGTLMFGMSPFGLRFFPMLAAFGALVVLSRLVTRLTKSEKAGLAFALIYALSCLTFGYGHVGTPLFIGVFFFACALDLVHRFYAKGIKKASFAGVLPLIFAGAFGALSICVNGAFLIPVVGVVGLFIAGMVRQQKAKKYALEKILAEPDPAPAAEGEEATVVLEKKRRAGRILTEYHFKNTAAPVLFASSLVVGTFLFALLGMLPAMNAYQRMYDNLASSSMNVFTLAWRAFAGGFVGFNAYGGGFNGLFEVLVSGELGSVATAALITINPVALVAGLFGVCYAVGRLIALARTKEHDKVWRSELRRTVILLAGLLISVITAVSVKSGDAFILLSYLFAFMLGASYFGKKNVSVAERSVAIVGLVLLALFFFLLLGFTFSIPLPAAVVGILG